MVEEFDAQQDENGKLIDIFGDDISDDVWAVREKLKEHSSTGGENGETKSSENV